MTTHNESGQVEPKQSLNAQRVQILVSPDVLARIDALAARCGMGRSAAGRVLVLAALEQVPVMQVLSTPGQLPAEFPVARTLAAVMGEADPVVAVVTASDAVADIAVELSELAASLLKSIEDGPTPATGASRVAQRETAEAGYIGASSLTALGARLFEEWRQLRERLR